MKVQTWVAVVITYVLLVSMVVLVGHILDEKLQTPPRLASILTGLSIFATTLGMVIAIIIFRAKGKK